jgi:soluble lytic murein transglycosylase-like protein
MLNESTSSSFQRNLEIRLRMAHADRDPWRNMDPSFAGMTVIPCSLGVLRALAVLARECSCSWDRSWKKSRRLIRPLEWPARRGDTRSNTNGLDLVPSAASGDLPRPLIDRLAIRTTTKRAGGALFRAARRLSSRRYYLTLLFTVATVLTWSNRWQRSEGAVVALPAEGVSVIATSGRAYTQVAASRTADVPGLSRPWEAPHLPERPFELRADHAGIVPSRTPAAEVERWTRRLAVDQRADTRAAIERMARYEPLVYHALRERGLPTDLTYLALIESGYSPRATSRAGAVGIWQFMPETARAYGLEISEYVDERRDPVRSTFAAIRHLEWLHRQFGSWHLAAAAYNAGDGRVGRLLRELLGGAGGDETLYWRIRSVLPAETREYVPKLLAAARIARSPGSHGIHDLAPRPPLRFRELPIEGGVPLSEVAARLGIDAGELRELNPHLIQGMTPPGRRWPVRVPADLPTVTQQLSARYYSRSMPKASRRAAPPGCSLILDVQRNRPEAEDVLGRHQRVAVLGIVVVEELESGVFDRLADDEVAIRVPLQPGGTPAVHVHDDLHLGAEADLT